MADTPQWGRQSRRFRRETARELAKEIMRSNGASKRGVDWPMVVAVLALAASIIFFLFARSVPLVLICLVAIFACTEYIVVHLLTRIMQRALPEMKLVFVLATVGSLISATALGYFAWPHMQRHVLTARERASFENALKPQKGGELEIQIACPLNEEKTCVYAEQFINLVGESGWKVQSYVSRLTLSRALAGVTIYRRGGTRDNSLKRWDAGGYFNINEPHLLALQSAFQSIHIEPEGGTNPDISENVMTVYFGPEKDNEADPTNLTRSTEWVTGKRKGPLPPQ